MTFNPDGDPGGAADDFPGSLFVMGHDRIPYGEVPDGNQVAEVSIPAPVNEKNLEALNSAEFLQNFANVAEGAFTALDEIPKVGMTYLNRPETGALIHLVWGGRTFSRPMWPRTPGSAPTCRSPICRVSGLSEIKTCTASTAICSKFRKIGLKRTPAGGCWPLGACATAGRAAWGWHCLPIAPGWKTARLHRTVHIWMMCRCCCMKMPTTPRSMCAA